MNSMLKVLILALIGGYLFSLLHIPIPWMLGPIVFIVTAQFLYKGHLAWSNKLCDIGVVIVGTSIGIQFDLALFSTIGSILFYMFLLNIILIASSFLIAFAFAKWSKISLKTAILGTIPGGLSQIILFAEHEKNVNIGVISYFQIIRLLLVVIVVPFIVAGHAISTTTTASSLSFRLIALIILAWIVSYFMHKIHFPVAYFITPILVLIAYQLATPITMPHMPSYMMAIAQLLIGAHIGLMLKPKMLKLPTRILLAGIFSSATLILFTLGSSFFMSWAMQTNFSTSFLSTAPGGLDQMVLLADSINADASLVSMFQTFRLLFIFLLVLPVMKYFYYWKSKKANQEKDDEALIKP